MKKLLMSCAALALLAGPAMAQEQAAPDAAAQMPAEEPILQKIIIEEVTVEPPAMPAEEEQADIPAEAASPAENITPVNEAAAEEERLKNEMKAATQAVQHEPEAQPQESASDEQAAEQAEPAPAAADAQQQAVQEEPVDEAPQQQQAEQQPAQPAAPEQQQAVQEAEPVTETEKQAVDQAATMEPEAEKTAATAQPEVYDESPAVRMLNEQELERLKAKQAAGLTNERVTQSIETTVITGPQAVPGVEPVNFMDFDLNGDGILARDEVGEKLFRSFDLDGNQVIDNQEMTTINVMTFIPMEKETIEVVEYYDSDKDEKVSISHEEFLETSKLIAYDEDKDGLSPLDFIGKPFNQIDVKDDKVIDLEEWKRAYEELTKQPHEEGFRYNG